MSTRFYFLVLLAVCLVTFTDCKDTNILSKASPESQGVPSEAIISFMDDLERNNLNMHSFILIRNGKILSECYWPFFSAEKKNRMYSVSKSFTAVAIGMMVDEGRISLDDKVADIFPEYLPEDPHPYILQATVRNLLTMSTFNPSTSSRGDNNWVRAFFQDPREKTEPGSRFNYDTSATNVLCGIVEKLSGMPILDYMRPVFDEIGISEDIWCIKSPDGRSWTGSGIICTSQDLARFALLCLNMGEWNGKQLISRKFMEDATSLHLETGERNLRTGLPGYGYQFWTLKDEGFACYGMGGQLALCIPSKNLILITTGDNQAISTAIQTIISAFYNFAEKIEKSTLPENREAQKKLNDKILNVANPLPIGSKTTSRATALSGVRYNMEDNNMGIKWMSLDISPEKSILNYENEAGIHSITLGMGEYIFQKFPEKYYGATIGIKDTNFDTIAAGAWQDENTFRGNIYAVDFYLGSIDLTLSFSDNKLRVTMRKVAEWFFDTYQGSAEGIAGG